MSEVDFTLPREGMAVEVVNQNGNSICFYTTRYPFDDGGTSPFRPIRELIESSELDIAERNTSSRLNITVIWNHSSSRFRGDPGGYYVSLLMPYLRVALSPFPDQRLAMQAVRFNASAPGVEMDMVCMDGPLEASVDETMGRPCHIIAWVRARIMDGHVLVNNQLFAVALP